VGEALLFALVGVRDGDTLELVALALDDDLFLVADDDVEIVSTEIGQLLETVGQNRLVSDFDHPFGFVLC
jgi:hypothetical protein